MAENHGQENKKEFNMDIIITEKSQNSIHIDRLFSNKDAM